MKGKTFYLVTDYSFCVDGGGVYSSTSVYETEEEARKEFNLEIFGFYGENREDKYLTKSLDDCRGNEYTCDMSRRYEPKSHMRRIEKRTFDTLDQKLIDEVEEEGFNG